MSKKEVVKVLEDWGVNISEATPEMLDADTIDPEHLQFQVAEDTVSGIQSVESQVFYFPGLPSNPYYSDLKLPLNSEGWITDAAATKKIFPSSYQAAIEQALDQCHWFHQKFRCTSEELKRSAGETKFKYDEKRAFKGPMVKPHNANPEYDWNTPIMDLDKEGYLRVKAGIVPHNSGLLLLNMRETLHLKFLKDKEEDFLDLPKNHILILCNYNRTADRAVKVEICIPNPEKRPLHSFPGLQIYSFHPNLNNLYFRKFPEENPEMSINA